MTQWRRLAAVVATVALIATACGDRGDEDAGAGTSEGAGEEAPDGGSDGTFGDLEGLCGPNEGGGALPDADASEVLGLSEDSISVSTISDPGFEGNPGLNVEMHDAAEAFVDWCNEAGGINGRQIDLTLRDAAITEYQPVLEQACDGDFALVGSGAVQDNLYADIGVGCDLIDIAGFSVTPEKAGPVGRDPIEARSVQPLPNPYDQLIVQPNNALADEAGDAVDHSGILFADFQTLITQADKVRSGWEAVGHTFVHENTYNVLGEANWAPFAAALEEAGVEYLSFVGEGQNLALLQQALEEIGYEIPYIVQEANFYDPNYLAAAGPAAEGTLIRTATIPFEEAADNPATQDYLELMEAQGGKVALLGAQAMSSWALFAQSARDCDRADDLTRSCVLETASEATEWTGGGLHAPTDPGSNDGPECNITLEVRDGAFERLTPEEGFDCSPDNLAPADVDI